MAQLQYVPFRLLPPPQDYSRRTATGAAWRQGKSCASDRMKRKCGKMWRAMTRLSNDTSPARLICVLKAKRSTSYCMARACVGAAISAAKIKVGGLEMPIEYVGAQNEYRGLDQVNIRLPRTLLGRGEVAVELTVEGQMANVVSLSFK